jgi:hypothetical protein
VNLGDLTQTELDFGEDTALAEHLGHLGTTATRTGDLDVDEVGNLKLSHNVFSIFEGGRDNPFLMFQNIHFSLLYVNYYFHFV